MLWNVATREIRESNGKVSALAYQDRATGEIHSLELSGVFVQIGLVPNSQFVKDLVKVTP